MTRRLASCGSLALFRATTAGELGPGCYVLKTTCSDNSNDKVAPALLRREAIVAAEVAHPNLTSVLVAETRADQPYLILPYLEGISLSCLIHRGSSNSFSPPHLLPAAYVLMLVRQIAAALAALHAARWLHGQVRPEHVIVSPHAHATLIDLTHARRLESCECDCGVRSLLEGRNVGPTYAAPESFSYRYRLTAAADTYSLGILLFELLAGRLPFAATSPRQLAVCHQLQAPPDLRPLRPGLSHEVAELVRRMLAKEPLRRPSDEQLIQWIAELEIEELRGARILACH